MRLDWNDIKARAAKFAGDWNGAHYEHGVDLPDKKRGYLDLFWKPSFSSSKNRRGAT
jgi:hypothetical protein